MAVRDVNQPIPHAPAVRRIRTAGRFYAIIFLFIMYKEIVVFMLFAWGIPTVRERILIRFIDDIEEVFRTW